MQNHEYMKAYTWRTNLKIQKQAKLHFTWTDLITTHREK